MTAPRALRSRRHTLIVRYTVLGLILVGLTTAALLLTGRKPSAYLPGGDVEGVTSDLSRALPSDRPRAEFHDAATQADIHFRHFPGVRTTQLPEDMGSGAAWGDYDNDGDDDLYICDIAAPLTATRDQIDASPGGNRLYRNNGDGTFTDVTQQSGTAFKGIANGTAWGDYDGDGWLDLLVTAHDRLILFRNRRDGTFDDVTVQAGLDRYRGFWTGVSWADYDRDGDLDVYITGYVKYEFHSEDAAKASTQVSAVVPFTLNPSSYPPERNLLLRNDGNGRFTDVAAAAGVANLQGRSLAAAWCDFDLDGWLDLYVANDISDNVLYRNLGNGKFEDISHAAWVADYRGAMGLAVGDYDRDGDFDIFVTHWIAQENALYWNMLRSPGQSESGGELKFTDVADMVGLGQVSLNAIGWGTVFFDFDNDGRLDLFAANGSTFQDEADPRKLRPMRHFLFWQKNPEDGFFDVSPASGPSFLQKYVGRGVAMSDYDNDGDIDLVVINHGAAPLLLHNDQATGNNWLKVRAVAPRSRRSVIGTMIEVEAGGFRQTEQIGCQPSYLSQNSLDAHFGLGRAAQVDKVTVRFPWGALKEFTGVAPNRTLVVEE